jgi:hypothetical protein
MAIYTLDQCKKYAPYSMSLFTTYLANAREADNKLIELRGKTELYRFLESHKVKDTLSEATLDTIAAASARG